MPKNTMIIVYLRRRGLVWRVEVEVGLKQGLDPLRGPTMVGAARRVQLRDGARECAISPHIRATLLRGSPPRVGCGARRRNSDPSSGPNLCTVQYSVQYCTNFSFTEEEHSTTFHVVPNSMIELALTHNHSY